MSPLRSAFGAASAPALALVALAVIVFGASVVAAPPALVLNDPTRPPAAWAAAVPGPSASGRVTGGEPARAEPARPAALPRLQSVQMRSSGPPTALIDDRLVKVGDAVGERVVQTIDHEGVVLRGAGGERRLRLLGGDEKQPPGSIQITRSARWQPDSQATDPRSAEPALAGASAPARPAPVSLAERTHP
jgi:hypothetical protein